jgi:hypothetical protein
VFSLFWVETESKYGLRSGMYDFAYCPPPPALSEPCVICYGHIPAKKIETEFDQAAENAELDTAKEGNISEN